MGGEGDPSAPRPVVDGYEVEAEVGRGGFATVYRATQTSVGRPVALKVVAGRALDEAAARRFHREVRAVGALSGHPHVVAVHDAGTTASGEPFIAMQLVEGGSWGDRVRRDGPLAPDRVAAIGAEVADALEAAHGAGITHRDIKPDNLLVGPRERTLVSDFGVATLGDGTRTASGTLTGTLAYTAPELLRGGRPDAASDVFALGATLHALLTGRSPFSGGDEDHAAAVLWRVANEEPAPLPPSVPVDLRDIVAACTAEDPTARPSVPDLLARLSALDPAAPAAPAPGTTGPGDGPTAVVPPTPPGPPDAGRPGPRWPRWVPPVAAVVLVALAAAGAAVVSAWAGGDGPDAGDVGLEASDTPLAAADAAERPVPEVATSLVVRDDPTGVSATATDVWVTHHLDGTVSRIDPATDAVVASLEVASFPDGIAVAQSGVWVTHSGTEGSVSRIDPATDEVVARIPVGSSPGAVAVTDDAVWVADTSDGTVSHIDPATDEVVATIDVGDGAFGLAADDDGVWVATPGNEVRRIDPATDEVVASVPTGVGPRDVALAGDGVWVTEAVAETISRIDTEVDQVGGTARLAPDPGALAAGGGDLWAATGTAVTRVDTATGATTGTVEVGAPVDGLAVADGALWVVTGDDDTVTRLDL